MAWGGKRGRGRWACFLLAFSNALPLQEPVLYARLFCLGLLAGASILIFSFASTRARFFGIIQLLAPTGLLVLIVLCSWGWFLFLLVSGLLLLFGGGLALVACPLGAVC